MESKTLIHARLTAPRSGIAPDLAIQSSPEGWSCSWAGGRMNVRKPATLAERNGVLCVSLGAPRFAEAGNNAAELWLTLFERRGAKAVDGVKGRYAVAFIDTRSNTVSLFNDRFDTEPWCYGLENGELALADRGATLIPESIPLARGRVISAVRKTYVERKTGREVECGFLQYAQPHPRPLPAGGRSEQALE